MNNICNLFTQLLNSCNISSLFNCFGGFGNIFGGNCF